MNALIRRWDFDDTTEWLRPTDLYLAEELLSHQTAEVEHSSVLEFGVWKGAWLLQVVTSQSTVSGVGIDPYPGSPTLRSRVLDRARSKGISDRVMLVADHAEACRRACGDSTSHRQYAVAHIDGLHVEKQVTQDLDYAAGHCASGGVIIIDDYLHPAYPGIASAMYQFLSRQGFAMLLVTRNKAYLCRTEQHQRWLGEVARVLDDSGLSWERYRGEHSGARYVQPPDVMGRPVLLCLAPENDRLVLDGLPRPTRIKVDEVAHRWVAPGVRDALHPVTHQVRTRWRRWRPSRPSPDRT